MLKDATSLAAYGSQAANGVVMITTKQGKLGKPVLNFNASWTLSEMANRPEVLSPENYIKKINATQHLVEDADPSAWMSGFELGIIKTARLRMVRLREPGGTDAELFGIRIRCDGKIELFPICLSR